PGNNYQLQYSIGDTIAELQSSPVVLTTPEFAVEPTVGSLNIVEQPLDPVPAGVTLEGVVAGQQMQVEVLDTTGQPMPNVEVAATITQCNGTFAGGNNQFPVPDSGLVFNSYCTFAEGDERGGGFASLGGAIDPTETGVRIIRATTNALGIATFSAANGNALTFSEPSVIGPYVVAFTTGFFDNGLGGVTEVTTPFSVIASELDSLLIDNDDDPTTIPTAQPLTVDATGVLTTNAAGGIFVLPLDRFSNVLDVATPVTVNVTNPASNPNSVYGDDGAGDLSNDAPDRREVSVSGAPGSGAGVVIFPAGDYYIAATGANGAATADAAIPAGAFAADMTASTRLRFEVLGTPISVTSDTIDFP
ncbi:MAG: hypothetical protein AAF267_21330, partial [Deinococcota bacterium]